MNPVLDAITRRRSIRAYKADAVPKDLIETIIDAGNKAPSSMNSQPWRFVVVQDAELKKRLLKAAAPQAQKIFGPLKEKNPERYEIIMKRFRELPDPIYYSAPVLIFVIGHGVYAQNSCPLACENMMLAAYSLGLGSCWVGLGAMVTDDAEIVKTLGLTDDEKIFGPILIGYPAEDPAPPEKKAPAVQWI